MQEEILHIEFVYRPIMIKARENNTHMDPSWPSKREILNIVNTICLILAIKGSYIMENVPHGWYSRVNMWLHTMKLPY